MTDISDEEESEEGETDISAGANDYTYFYEYDSFNRLKKSSGKGYVTTYAYDGNNLRQSKTSNGVTTNHYYDGQNVALDETNGNFTAYNRGLGLLSRTNQNGTQYYHFNIHGDTSALTDSNGEIVLDYRYDAFGNQLKSNENDTNPFRYNGEYFDEETGFIYLRNRYYDPNIGRFVTEDPHWNVNNMIYGVEEKTTHSHLENSNDDVKPFESQEDNNSVNEEINNKINEFGNEPNEKVLESQYTLKIPSSDAITQASNLYVYCKNNPIGLKDKNGEVAGVDDCLFIAGMIVTTVVAVYVASKYQKPANVNRRKGAENRGPNPKAPGKNEQHGDCENHSQRPKGGTRMPSPRR